MKMIYLLPAIGFGICFGGNANAATPTANEVAKLLASDATSADYFGYAVAVDQDTALIGAYLDDDQGTDSGSAYVFTRDSSGIWSLQQKLTASDGTSDVQFGWSVAIEGDTAVIGAYAWEFFDPLPGSAYVFSRDSNGVWSEQQKLTAFDGVSGDSYGNAVAISGDSILIGAYGDDDMGTDSGSAYIYTRDSVGAWGLQQKLTASDGRDYDTFGRSVAMDMDTAVIGAWSYDDSGGSRPDTGSAYVFTRDSNGVWSEQQNLIASDAATYDFFGRSVAVVGDTAVIGADRTDDNDIDTDTGSAYVFTRDTTGSWTEQQKLTASNAVAGDFFGYSVAMDGDNLVIGAYGDDDNGTDAGSAYVFSRDSTGVWSEQLKLLSSDGVAYDYLGYFTGAVGVSGSTVIAGAPLHDTPAGDNTGAGYIFNIPTSTEGPNINVSPTAVDFGDVLLGQTADQTLTLSNNGTSDLTLDGIFILSGVDFSQTNDCPISLPAATSCLITVTFTPTNEGVLSDTLSILSNDADQPTVNVALSGSASLVQLLPDLTVTKISAPRTLSPDKLASISVTVGNQGEADVSGSYTVSLSLSGILLNEVVVSDVPLAGTEVEISLTVRIPDLSSGNYLLEAAADSYDVILELDETNNSLTKSVKIN